MERSFDNSVIQCSELAGLAEKGGGNLETASLTCKHTYEMNCLLGSHSMDFKPVNATAASFLFYPGNEAPEAPVCNGAARISPLTSPPTRKVFPTASVRGIPLLNGHYLGPRTLPCDTGILGELSCIWKPYQAQPNKVDVQLSDVCERRFVMFDHSGSKRKMIFHPAMVNDFTALLPSSPMRYNLEATSGVPCAGKDTNLVRSCFPPHTCQLGASFRPYNSYLMPVTAAMDSISSASDNCGTLLRADGANVANDIEINHNNSSPQHSYFSHENTEDLEALLSSDEDEVSSTGHSPSDLTRNNSLTAYPTNSEGYSMCNIKKRKRESELYVDDDTSSTATSGNNTCKDLSSQKLAGADNHTAFVKSHLALSEAGLLGPIGYGSATPDSIFPDEGSSSSSANNEKLHKELPGWQMPQPPQRQLQTEQTRKDKIKNILRLLRGIIPGGEFMDTAFVLDEAIQYVRTLQSEVQKLQARKLV